MMLIPGDLLPPTGWGDDFEPVRLIIAISAVVHGHRVLTVTHLCGGKLITEGWTLTYIEHLAGSRRCNKRLL